MTEIEKVAAILRADLPDALKLELIQKVVGPPEQTVTIYPTYPQPWYPAPTYPTYRVNSDEGVPFTSGYIQTTDGLGKTSIAPM